MAMVRRDATSIFVALRDITTQSNRDNEWAWLLMGPTVKLTSGCHGTLIHVLDDLPVHFTEHVFHVIRISAVCVLGVLCVL